MCACAWRAVWRPVPGVGPVACVCARLLWAVVCLLPRSLLGGFCRGGGWSQPGVSGLLHPSPRWGIVRGVWWPVWPFRPPAVCSGACGAPPSPSFPRGVHGRGAGPVLGLPPFIKSAATCHACSCVVRSYDVIDMLVIWCLFVLQLGLMGW